MSLEWMWEDGFACASRLYKKQLEINKQLSEENARLREQLKGNKMHAVTNLNTQVYMSEQEVIEVLTAHVRKIANIPAEMELEDSWVSGNKDGGKISFQAFFTREVKGE